MRHFNQVALPLIFEPNDMTIQEFDIQVLLCLGELKHIMLSATKSQWQSIIAIITINNQIILTHTYSESQPLYSSYI